MIASDRPVGEVWGVERRTLPHEHGETGYRSRPGPVGGVWGAERRALPSQLD